MDSSSAALISWFKSRGGYLNEELVGFQDLPVFGRSAVALKDIEEGATLFTIPRDILLSTRTSSLPEKLGEQVWKSLGQGWATLILCMMYEQALGASSKWAGYLDILPPSFSTPMFWSDKDLLELKGTSIEDKIGKDDANAEYQNRIVPLVQSRPDLFPPTLLSTVFSLDNFHRLGSSILSRSFHIEKSEVEGESVQEEHEHADHHDHDHAPADSSAMEIDGEDGNEPAEDPENICEVEEVEVEEEDDGEDEEVEDTGDVAMVPMADMLNARYESDNARLFYEDVSVSMITTKAIKAGEQIWNTYGDPPNSDLLRRYGHVDDITLQDGELGSPADLVEIKADLVVQSAQTSASTGQERIDWYLEEGGDDVFVLESNADVPYNLIGLVRLLTVSHAEWESKFKQKSNPHLEYKKITIQTVPSIIKTLQARLAQYPTSLEDDRELLISANASLPETLNLRNAIIVRMSEKKILTTALRRCELLKERFEKEEAEAASKAKGASFQKPGTKGSNKRKNEPKPTGTSVTKRAKR